MDPALDLAKYVEWTDGEEINQKNIAVNDETLALEVNPTVHTHMGLFARAGSMASGSNSTILPKISFDGGTNWEHFPRVLGADVDTAADRFGLTLVAGAADSDLMIVPIHLPAIYPDSIDIQIGVRVNLVTAATNLTLLYWLINRTA